MHIGLGWAPREYVSGFGLGYFVETIYVFRLKVPGAPEVYSQADETGGGQAFLVFVFCSASKKVFKGSSALMF